MAFTYCVVRNREEVFDLFHFSQWIVFHAGQEIPDVMVALKFQPVTELEPQVTTWRT